MALLVTGGAGYIGSHTVVTLLLRGYDVIVYDNFCNSTFEAIARVENITGRRVRVENGDIRDSVALGRLLSEGSIQSVLHFAGMKAVAESIERPLDYYDNNVSGTVSLLKAMNSHDVKELVFSSSATIYGAGAPVPYSELSPRGLTSSPYGATKSIIESILEDLVKSDTSWKISSLRYFNPIGAHESGVIGEAPNGVPDNLMPYISQVAVGVRNKLSIFGGDYPTHDGTCLRDYIHVMDVAEGHLSALERLSSGFEAINLGTGTPVSVLELVHCFQEVNKVSVPYEIVERRGGDLPAFWADVSKAKEKLNWKSKRSLEQAVYDSWKWQKSNPKGYS